MKVRSYTVFLAVMVAILGSGTKGAQSQVSKSPSVSTFADSGADKPYLVEWVYRIKWGHQEEFFEIFKKYQVPILEREKQLGYVSSYAIYAPGFHAGEDSRWDYRVVIKYKNQGSAGHAEEISKQLFPDRASLKKDEQRRWELTEVHWDLPIHVVDPGSE